MNIFQNIYVLTMALSVIDFSRAELEIIRLIVNNRGHGVDFYNDKLKVFVKIMKYFYGKDASIFFIVQGNNLDDKIEQIPAHVLRDDCQLFKIAVPCYIGPKDGGIQCAQVEYKNESDDVISLLLYKILKERANPEQLVILWSYDNYDWFRGDKDMRQVQLKYLTDKPNTLIEFIIGDIVDRKNHHVQSTIINFNGENLYSWDNLFYQNVIKNILAKHQLTNYGAATDITNEYKNKVLAYMQVNRIPHRAPVHGPIFPRDPLPLLPPAHAPVPVPVPIPVPVPVPVPDPDAMNDGIDDEGMMDDGIDAEEGMMDEGMDADEGMDDYDMRKKYLKYKSKYLELKNKSKKML